MKMQEKEEKKNCIKSKKNPQIRVNPIFASSKVGAGDRTRTGTPSLAVDFESTTSTIPSHRQLYFQWSSPKRTLRNRRSISEVHLKTA